MSKKSDSNEFLLNRILVFGIILLCIYLLTITLYTFKLNNNEYCGREIISDSTGTNLVSGITIGPQDTAFQEFTFIDSKGDLVVGEDYLFSFVGNASDNCLLYVVDGVGNVLGVIPHFANDTKKYSVYLNSTVFNKKEYLGINTINCPDQYSLDIYKDLNGEVVDVIVGNYTDFTLNTTNSLDYSIIASKSCKKGFKRINKLFFWTLIVMMIIILLIIYFNQLEKEVDI